LNRGKTVETGKKFGKMLTTRVSELETKLLIQIESPESAYGKLILLNEKSRESFEKLSEVLGLPAEIPSFLQNSICIEECPENGPKVPNLVVTDIVPEFSQYHLFPIIIFQYERSFKFTCKL
jgi:hypothetical protein